MTSTGLPAPAPHVTPETKPYWDAAAEGRLLLRTCQACATVIWYPRSMCPECGSFDTDWIEAGGRGTIFTFSINHRGQGAYQGASPYVLAYVELEEGPRMMTNIVDCDVDAIRIGDPVQVVFHDTGADTALPRFRPAT